MMIITYTKVTSLEALHSTIFGCKASVTSTIFFCATRSKYVICD